MTATEGTDIPVLFNAVTNPLGEGLVAAMDAPGGNVTGVHYERGGTKSVNGCFLRITLEARNYDHADEIVHALEAEGFRIAER